MSNTISLFFYLVIFSLSALLVGKNKYYAWIGIFFLVFISGIRFNVGTDFLTYINQFERAKLATWQSILNIENFINELGFMVLLKFSSYGSRQIFLGLNTAIPLLLIFKVLSKEYRRVNIGICFLFFLFVFFPISFNIMRQFIAISIIFYSLKYVFSKQFFHYLTCIIVAFLFHKTAIVAIPIFFLWSKKDESVIRGYKLWMTLIVITLITINYQTFLDLFTPYDAFEKYSAYNSVREVGSNRDLFVRLLIMIVILILGKHLVKMDKRNGLFIIMYIISVLIGITGFMDPQIKRMSLYFELPLIILIGVIPKIFNKKSELIINAVIILYSFLYFVLVYYFIGSGDIFPYKIN